MGGIKKTIDCSKIKTTHLSIAHKAKLRSIFAVRTKPCARGWIIGIITTGSFTFDNQHKLYIRCTFSIIEIFFLKLSSWFQKVYYESEVSITHFAFRQFLFAEQMFSIHALSEYICLRPANNLNLDLMVRSRKVYSSLRPHFALKWFWHNLCSQWPV